MQYYLIFKDTDRWWKPFCKKGFGHVFMIFKSEGTWIQFEVINKYHIVKLNYDMTLTDDEILQAYSDIATTILSVVTTDHDKKRWIGFLNIMTNCVNAVSNAMGLRINAFTPYGLYKKLVKLGNSSIKHRNSKGIYLVIEKTNILEFIKAQKEE